MHFPYYCLQFGLQESNLSSTFMVQIDNQRPEMNSIARVTNRTYSEKHKPKKRGNY